MPERRIESSITTTVTVAPEMMSGSRSAFAWGQVEAGIARGQGLDFRFRNADQDNGLGMGRPAGHPPGGHRD